MSFFNDSELITSANSSVKWIETHSRKSHVDVDGQTIRTGRFRGDCIRFFYCGRKETFWTACRQNTAMGTRATEILCMTSSERITVATATPLMRVGMAYGMSVAIEMKR
jgi:hypothetical protein